MVYYIYSEREAARILAGVLVSDGLVDRVSAEVLGKEYVPVEKRTDDAIMDHAIRRAELESVRVKIGNNVY
ncbi:hypothetical protein COU62_00600 [Candidatus Pacearchaeota archaeon CG10_big_fil_rev_8_21_14_0_10_35_219]|nr:hypothetical protein [Candidatus Pacearchaeota archaeon]OIO42687.1 MAG: hypothetical protein AUJ63_02125 [Candidatus Pacearchaeota archaeon CG1_02_35_32]PIO08289.1 MAG: hypothetical protein COU62_00600 [Candidatus Pacearchaeota archaeon CG10_big_fil_rev_8_21_14_0_10_35_219]PIY81890.1 MAG: hypothetical protein COY79_00340 [Candidatus Pacearchaeota archaeon CG_4_10_14_0_8_um_filter_35_169]PIZ79369.1 MAG: hypothetical protein COY00_04295 [Candidatus Pacearchaeota archaeon CG_4_10_14_0_2_um_filt